MVCAGAVAGLAADIHLRPGGPVGAALGVVAAAQRGGVAGGALVIPGLLRAGPVKGIAGGGGRSGLQVKPALAARGGGAGVPGYGEVLQPPAGQRNQQLLQRLDAENMSGLEAPPPAVGPGGLYKEAPALLQKAQALAAGLNFRAAEIAQNAAGRGGLHGEGVVRAAPGFGRAGVTGRALGLRHIARVGALPRLRPATGERKKQGE